MQRLPIRHIWPRYLGFVPGVEELRINVTLGRLGLDGVSQAVVLARELSELWNVGEDEERTVGDRVFVTEFKGQGITRRS